MNKNGAVVVDLDKFTRSLVHIPPTRHVVNKIMGGFLVHSIKNLASNFYSEKPNLDEYQLLLAMKKEHPHESEEEYTYALNRARQIYNEFKRAYQTGVVHGVGCSAQTINMYDNVFLEGKPTLLAKNTKEIYLIKTFALRSLSDMPDLFFQSVGMSFLFPSYRIWLIGFASRGGRIQSKIIDVTESDRQRFILTLKKYVEEKEVIK